MSPKLLAIVLVASLSTQLVKSQQVTTASQCLVSTSAMMQSLHQPSLDLSPASSPLSGSGGEITVIPNTPTAGDRSSSRNLLPIFSSARESERGSASLSSEYLANELPAWCANGGSRSSATPSSRHSMSESPGSSASSSVSSADNCKLFCCFLFLLLSRTMMLLAVSLFGSPAQRDSQGGNKFQQEGS